MLSVAIVLVVAASLAILAGGSDPARNAVVLLGKSILVTIAAGIVWSVVVWTIPIGSIARSFGVFTIGPWWIRAILIGPPLLTGIVFAIASWAWRARR